MRKRYRIKGTFVLLLSLVLQLFLPMLSAFASTTNSSILPPSNLAYQLVTPDDVKLTWSPVYGATGYKVYGIASGQLIPVGTVTSATYSLNDLPEGSYSYVVSTLSSEGESGPCAPLTFAVSYPDMTTPSNLTYTVQNGNDIVLSWGASPYVQTYNIYMIGPDGESTVVASTAARSYTVSNAPAGTYTYRVSAVNSLYGESPLSNPLQVTLVLPTMTKPGNLTYTVSNGSDVTLRWNAVSYASGYKVYQIVDGQKILKSTVTGTTVTYTNLPAGDYLYEVYSYSDRFGESAEGSPISLTLDNITLTAPANFAYKIQNVNDVVLTWSSVPNALNYKVYQVVDGQKILKSTVTGTTVTYTNLPAGDYIYEVHSNSDRFGESVEGSQVSLAIDAVTMTAPSNFAYKIQNGNDIVLTWGSVTNATGYKVYQVVNGQKTLKSTVTGTTVTYANSPAGDYTYEVHSNSTRFGESAEGSQVTFPLVLPVMEAPANAVQTIKNATDYSLSWEASAYATSYKIYLIVDGQKVLKNTVTGTTVAYTGMAPGTYVYEVHSFSSRFGESPEGTQVTVTLDGQTMQAPTNLTYSILNGNDVTLRWTAAPYATSYKVYQVIDGQKVLKSTLTGTAVTYTNLPAGEYSFIVDSVSALLGESPEGAQVTFSLVLPVMTAPGNLAYKIQNGNNVVLTWTAVSYATSYKVYELVDGQQVLKSTVSGLTATISNVPAGNRTYSVHSVSTRFGESAEGSQVTFNLDQQFMTAPPNLTQTVTNGNDITLRWGSVTYATAYKVYQIIDGQKVLKSTVTGTAVTYANQPAGEYSYEVHSYSDRFGESVEGSVVNLSLVFPTMQPPGGLTNSVANGNDITLKWSAVQYATGYKVYQIVDGQKVLKKTLSGISVTFTNQPEGEYSYEVHSYSDRFGESAEGSAVNLDLVFPTMQPPGGLTDTITNGNDITLKWSAVQYATGYKVYQIVDGQKVLTKTLSGISVTFTNQPQGEYSYEVHSYSDRFGESEEGSKISFPLVWPVVQPPVLKGVVFNANNITFSWQAVSWANEYRIYEVKGDSRQLIYKGTALTFKVYNLSEDTHSYEITAYNTRFGESAPSDRLTETIVYPVMQAPTATLTLLDKSTAQISWSFITYANGYNVYEIVDGKPVILTKNLNNLSYTVPNLSYANHEFYVTSFSNSFGESDPSNTVLAKLIVDTEPPVTTAQAPAAWTNQSQVITLTATDNETGVANTYYALDDGAFTEGTSVPVSDEGIHKLTFYSVDKAGNTEKAQTVEVKIDKTAPVTTANAPAAWSAEAVTVNLAATDAQSGVAKTLYSVNGSAYTEGTTLQADQEGINQVSFYSVDKAGNTEKAQTVEVKIDKTAPVTTANAPAAWSAEAVTVNLAVTDAQSGVAKTFYSVNGSAYTEGITLQVDQEGINQVSFYSVDKAGNTEKAQTFEVKIDKTAPVVSIDLAGEYKLGTNLQITYSATDALSGVVSDKLTVTGPGGAAGIVVANGGYVKLDQPGVYVVTVTATDAAGLTTTVRKQFTVYIQGNVEVTPKVMKGNNGIFTVRVDLPAGYSSEAFDLNTATLNGVKALASNKGYYNQAKLGQFKFERSDFNWSAPEVTVEFRGYLGGYLVVGQTVVKTQ